MIIQNLTIIIDKNNDILPKKYTSLLKNVSKEKHTQQAKTLYEKETGNKFYKSFYWENKIEEK